ncbi:hypothetical protein BDZ97DRAFT_1905193 [Flammula alnicola]|nr:hypothetical protein BDZ97DRAFT_1905193 [Flammula alnicola]
MASSRLPFGLYAKQTIGAFEEGLATQYVSEHTSIPVPHVLDVILLPSYPLPNAGLILMTSVPGRTLGSSGVPIDEMSSQQVDIFVETPHGWFEQLRFRIQNIAEGPTSQDEFHAQPFCTPWEPYDASRLYAAIEKRRTTRYRICFTHGDINPTNILVDENLRPSALVDWQTASWMPEYWEYTRTIYLRRRYTGWYNAFRRIFPRMNLSMRLRWLCGCIGFHR